MKTSGNTQHTAIDTRAKFNPAEVINIGIRRHRMISPWTFIVD